MTIQLNEEKTHKALKVQHFTTKFSSSLNKQFHMSASVVIVKEAFGDDVACCGFQREIKI